MEMERKCKNCISWQRDSADGVCRSKSPQPGIVNRSKDSEYILVWPRTNSEEWCMQFVQFIEVAKG